MAHVRRRGPLCSRNDVAANFDAAVDVLRAARRALTAPG